MWIQSSTSSLHTFRQTQCSQLHLHSRPISEQVCTEKIPQVPILRFLTFLTWQAKISLNHVKWVSLCLRNSQIWFGLIQCNPKVLYVDTLNTCTNLNKHKNHQRHFMSRKTGQSSADGSGLHSRHISLRTHSLLSSCSQKWCTDLWLIAFFSFNYECFSSMCEALNLMAQVAYTCTYAQV